MLGFAREQKKLSVIMSILQGDRFNEEDTLILTALSTTPDQSTQDPPDAKTREVFFATVLTKLRKRGISLRHQVCLLYYQCINLLNNSSDIKLM